MEAELPSCKGWLTKKAVTSGGTYQYQWRWTVLDRCVLSFWDTEEDWENGRPCEDQLNFFAVVKGSDRGYKMMNIDFANDNFHNNFLQRLRADASGESPEEQLRNVLRHSPFELLEDLFVEKSLCRACFDAAAYEMEVEEDQSESCGGDASCQQGQQGGKRTHQLHWSSTETRGEDAENSRLPPG
eukprot:g14683.t1